MSVSLSWSCLKTDSQNMRSETLVLSYAHVGVCDNQVFITHILRKKSSYSTCAFQPHIFLVHWHFSCISESAFLQGRLRHFLGRSNGGHPALTACWWLTTACLIRPPVGLTATGSQGQRLGGVFWEGTLEGIGYTAIPLHWDFHYLWLKLFRHHEFNFFARFDTQLW